MKFVLINDITESKVKSASYVIYAHLNTMNKKCYIGYSNCAVGRWLTHSHESNRDSHHAFKQDIQKYGKKFNHFIIGIAKTEEEAKILEEQAIAFYKPEYNSNIPAIFEITIKFSLFTEQDCKLGWRSDEIDLERKDSRSGSSISNDKNYDSIIGETFYENGKIEVRPIKGQKYSTTLKIQCPKQPRYDHPVGTKFRLQVILKNQRGTDFLSMPSTWPMDIYKE